MRVAVMTPAIPFLQHTARRYRYPLVFNLGLPKSGTSSLQKFMEQAYARHASEEGPPSSEWGWEAGRACHWLLERPADRVAQAPRPDGAPHVGLRKIRGPMVCDSMRAAIADGKPLLHYLLRHSAPWSGTGGRRGIGEHHKHHNCTAITQADCLCDPMPVQAQVQHVLAAWDDNPDDDDDNTELRRRAVEQEQQRAVCPDPFFPQINHLKELDELYPDARFVLMQRSNGKEWAASVAGHVGGWKNTVDANTGDVKQRTGTKMLDRLKAGDIPGLPPGEPTSAERLILWQEDHHAAVRRRFAGRKNKLFELDIADDVSAEKAAALATFLGFPAEYGAMWSTIHANPRGHFAKAGQS